MQNQSSVQQIIQMKLEAALNPSMITVENESHMHGGQATESHFKLTVVAEQFSNLPRVKRHQHVYALLSQELNNGIHALALHLYSPVEWEQRQQSVAASPECRGGSKTD
ncbi:MAG TPA: transcriptional regulator [Gammaproteobacteria bacterium]|jgi:BolA protein|nr:BolA family protein [Gammaproteobacteria bacterium]HAJ76634.1 transcriptional regulator [Gammaproteobacteria bacterium]|tara:strand:+ start:1176 stop:1502 length:327 start_codon:yes stop_codon:yes gene_type:complete